MRKLTSRLRLCSTTHLLCSVQVETHSYRPFDDPQPEDPSSVVLSREQLREADPHILAADEQLGAGFQV